MPYSNLSPLPGLIIRGEWLVEVIADYFIEGPEDFREDSAIWTYVFAENASPSKVGIAAVEFLEHQWDAVQVFSDGWGLGELAGELFSELALHGGATLHHAIGRKIIDGFQQYARLLADEED
jgi:hypothetical protein